MLEHIWPLPQKYIVSFKVISLSYHKISTAKACVLSSMPSNMQLNSSGARYYKLKSQSYSPSSYFHIIPIKPEFPLMLIPASLGYPRYNEILIYPVQYTGGKYILSNMLGGSQNHPQVWVIAKRTHMSQNTVALITVIYVLQQKDTKHN